MLVSASVIRCGEEAHAPDKNIVPLKKEQFGMLSKAQIIEAIQQINRTARADWLGVFDVSALRRYLDHLQLTLEPRGAGSTWVRPGDTKAIVTREAIV